MMRLATRWDARAMEIAEGTVEKMRTAIALIEAKNRA